MEKSTAYYVGMIAGFLFAFALIFVLTRLMKRVGGKFDSFGRKNSYDERQMVARGKAYKSAFFSLIIMVITVGVLNEIAGIKLFMCMSGMLLIVVISTMIFAIICISEEAYMSLNENVRGVNIMFGILAIINMVAGIMNVTEHGIIKDGKFSVESMNLWCGILFTVLLAAFNIKYIVNKDDSEDE